MTVACARNVLPSCTKDIYIYVHDATHYTKHHPQVVQTRKAVEIADVRAVGVIAFVPLAGGSAAKLAALPL